MQLPTLKFQGLRETQSRYNTRRGHLVPVKVVGDSSTGSYSKQAVQAQQNLWALHSKAWCISCRKNGFNFIRRGVEPKAKIISTPVSFCSSPTFLGGGNIYIHFFYSEITATDSKVVHGRSIELRDDRLAGELWCLGCLQGVCMVSSGCLQGVNII